MVDVVIKNGKVVFPDLTIETAISIDKGKIVAIGSNTVMPKAEKVIDAKGKFVLPGGVDPHDHTGLPRHNFFNGTKATSWGGTTTLITFARGGLEGIKEKRAEADERVVIDYAIHANIGNITLDTQEEILDEIPKLIDYGVPTFKIFMVYGNAVDDNTILKLQEKCKAHGGLLCVHAENNDMIEFNRAEAVKMGHKEAIYHARTRPPITEAAAINTLIFLSNYLKTPYMNMHLSIKEGVDMMRKARNRGDLVYAETCSQYLSLTEEKLKGPRGIYYICTPPLRTQEHIDGLWKGLQDGTISVVASDHSPNTTDLKIGKDNFTQVPNGCPGQEYRLPILFSEGVVKRRININRLSEIFSTNAAKIHGLYPKKGAISVGSDADLVILDPKLEKTVTLDLSPSDRDWSPYEGMKLKGWPITTISKGKVIWEDNEFQGKQGDGEFLKRSLPKGLFNELIA